MEGKRKLVFHSLVQFLVTVLTAMGNLDGDAYAQITGYNVAAFGAGNGLEHIGRALGRNGTLNAIRGLTASPQPAAVGVAAVGGGIDDEDSD